MRPLVSLGSAPLDLLPLLLCATAAASSAATGEASPAAETRAPGGEAHEEASGPGALALGSGAGAGDTELLAEAASAVGLVGAANGQSDDLGGESRSCMPLSM